MEEPTGERKAADEVSSVPVVEVAMGDAPDLLGDLVTRARIAGQRTVLVRYGKQVAAIVPIADYERLKMTAA